MQKQRGQVHRPAPEDVMVSILWRLPLTGTARVRKRQIHRPVSLKVTGISAARSRCTA